MAAALGPLETVGAPEAISAPARLPCIAGKVEQPTCDRIGQDDLFPVVEHQHGHRRGVQKKLEVQVRVVR
jgi:hypothetical protein